MEIGNLLGALTLALVVMLLIRHVNSLVCYWKECNSSPDDFRPGKPIPLWFHILERVREWMEKGIVTALTLIGILLIANMLMMFI